MKETPILMNIAMVKATLEGRKTQTRRVMKGKFEFGSCISEEGIITNCPYGKVGDLLWVRETHYVDGLWYENGVTKTGKKKHSFLAHGIKDIRYCDNPPKHIQKGKKYSGWYKRPSIFMFVEYARIWLKIKDIRVERLQDISEDDAIKEGIDLDSDFSNLCQNILDNCGEHSHDVEKSSVEIATFKNLWDSINGKPRNDGVDISWKANPYVWVVEFERVDREAI